MRILHYSLGVPPYRSGGMTAWSVDLMKRQLADGVEVTLLYPADIGLFDKKIRIKQSRGYMGITVFKLLNPLPIPLIYGIDSSYHYLNYVNPTGFDSFFEGGRYDALHVHTLMGLPQEFLESARRNKVKILYTAHDTFGVWPEPDLGDRNNGVDPIFNLGYIGNQAELSYKKIFIMQTSFYRAFKSSRLLERLKLLIKKQQRVSRILGYGLEATTQLNNVSRYQSLREHYRAYFNYIDEIHFNSELTRSIFHAYGIENNSFVSAVYHSSMNIHPKDMGMGNRDAAESVNILYNGTREQYKGYDLLLEVLDSIYENDSMNFTLTTYGTGEPDREYIRLKQPYALSEISSVYSGADITVVPSLYFETFGMVVPESLGYGVPLVVSRTVGSKSLLSNGLYGNVFSSKWELREQLLSMIRRKSVIQTKRDNILQSKVLVFSADTTYCDIQDSYKRDTE